MNSYLKKYANAAPGLDSDDTVSDAIQKKEDRESNQIESHY